MQYICNVVITEKIKKYPDRAETDCFFNFPYVAIEEVLFDSVCHRAYDECEPIEIRVENDLQEKKIILVIWAGNPMIMQTQLMEEINLTRKQV